jgi:SPP1 gp7 family putative phage head morphogenesis protein
MTYQPPVGVWDETLASRLLWATAQVLHRLEKQLPEQPEVDRWTARITRLLAEPVAAYGWEAWYRLSTVKQEEGPDVPEEILAAWRAVFNETGPIRELWLRAAEIRTRAEGVPFDPEDLEAGLRSTFHHVRGITDTERETLRRMMRDALEREVGQLAFARAIRREFRRYARWKAEQIAVTEWNRAASAATLTGYKRMGVRYKRWFTVADDRVCPLCEANAAEGDIPIEAEFPGGVEAPPQHPSCRCNISSA